MAPEPTRSAVRTAVLDHPFASFVALALAVSWSVWVPGFLALPSGSAPGSGLLVMAGAFGPGVAAALLVRLRGGSVRAWLGDVLAPRTAPRWYLLALATPALLAVIVGGLLYTRTGSLDRALLVQRVPVVLFGYLYVGLLGGGQEEFGWRGFALPTLQRRTDALTASVVLGLVWAVWHVPLFLFDFYSDVPFALYALTVVAFSVLHTWLYNSSRGTLPVVMLLHGGINVVPNNAVTVVGADAGTGYMIAFVVAAWAAALAVLAYHGRRTLSAGQAVTPADSSLPTGPRRSTTQHAPVNRSAGD